MSLQLSQHCLGCGKDVASSAGTRCLSGDKSQHIVPLWISIFGDELQKRGEREILLQYMTDGRKICRKCFSAYERCTKIMHALKQDVAKALDVIHANMSTDNTFLAPPAPKKLEVSAGTSSSSPDVSVNTQLMLNHIKVYKTP